MWVRCNFLLVLATASVFLGCSGKPVSDERYITLKVYHTNDIHAHLMPNNQGQGGLAHLASVLKVVRQQEKNAIIVDGGDFYRKGSLPARLSEDEVAADILSMMPYYDLRVVGNNEVNLGIDRLFEIAMKKEKAPLISANLVDKEERTAFPPYLILKKSGLKVAVIGLTYEFDLQWSQPKSDPRAPYKFLNVDEVLPSLLKKLQTQADLIFLVSHQEFDFNEKLAKKYPQVDLIIGGHSHTLTPDKKILGKGLLVEAGEYGRHIGVVNVIYDTVEKKVVSQESTAWPIGIEMQLADPKIAEAIQKAYEKWAPDALKPIGEAKEDLKILCCESRIESGLTDWTADLFKKVTKSDFAFVVAGMFRENILEGVINKDSVVHSTPYPDEIVQIKISKKRLREMLVSSLKDSYRELPLVRYAFSGATAILKMDPERREIKSADLRIHSPKETISVGLSLYVVKNCKEFFQAKYCPLPEAKGFGSVQKTIENEIIEKKSIAAPTADRVIVN